MEDTCPLCGVKGHNRQTCPNTIGRAKDTIPAQSPKPVAQAFTLLTETIKRLDEKTGQLHHDLGEILRPADSTCSEPTPNKELPTSPIATTINNHVETLQTIAEKIEDILERLEI